MLLQFAPEDAEPLGRSLATWHLFDMGCHYRRFRPVGVLPSNVQSADYFA